jgi:hypothetical protein
MGKISGGIVYNPVGVALGQAFRAGSNAPFLETGREFAGDWTRNIHPNFGEND